VGFSVSEGDPHPSSDLQFEPFFWNGRKEDEALEDARGLHIRKSTEREFISLGGEDIKVSSVHTINNLLNVVIEDQ
jgi:hypothetical protein